MNNPVTNNTARAAASNNNNNNKRQAPTLIPVDISDMQSARKKANLSRTVPASANNNTQQQQQQQNGNHPMTRRSASRSNNLVATSSNIINNIIYNNNNNNNKKNSAKSNRKKNNRKTTGSLEFAYVAPESFAPKDVDSIISAAAATTISCERNSDCAICLCDLQKEDNIVQLSKCHHVFHKDCLLQALAMDTKCPICRVPFVEPQGQSPSGTMTVQLDPTTSVSGHEGKGSIIITYNISGGIQKTFHDNPGAHYGGTYRVAYLPHNDAALDLCKRLVYAFLHGLVFRVGTSLTTGRNNVVTWASIHHKTTPYGGQHGWPDDGFFWNCHEELNHLKVPPASDLDDLEF